MFEEKLCKYVRRLLQDRPASKTIRQIAEETGINYWWLIEFHSGKRTDGSVSRIEKLHHYLTGRDLI